MTRISICLSIVMSIAASAVWAQDPAPTTPTQPDSAPTADPVSPADPVPPTVPPAPLPEPLPSVEQPQVTPQWTYERQRQNQQGTVTNTHRYLDAPEDGRYVREHVVTNPRGEMTQTWERVNTEDGYEYRRSQVWLNPDGTPLRQHERTMAGTDTVQLSWWQKLNPFRKRGNPTAASAFSSAPRRGFTIGTGSRNSARRSSVRSGDHPSVSGSQNTHRPSWAGGAPRSVSPQGPPVHANSHATASRPNPGRGPSPSRGPNR